MKLRNTILLLLLAGGLFAYLKFVDSKQLSTEELLERKGKFIAPESLDRKQVTGVTIRNSEGTIELAGNDQTWKLTAPVQDNAESFTVSALFTTLEGLTGREVQGIKDVKEAHKEFGLVKGDISVKLAGPKPVEILIGKDTAIEGRVYARIDGSDTIYTIPRQLRDDLSKGVKDWRDRRLSDLTASQINKIAIKTEKGEIELEKKQNNWSFTKPFKARGDNQKINDLIANATTPRIEEFLTDSKDFGAYGLNEPRATITFTAEGVEQPVILKIGAAKVEKKEDKPAEEKNAAKPEDNKEDKPAPPQWVYVSLSSRQGVVTVPAAIESLIATLPNDLRDQSLLRVEEHLVDRITIEAPGREKIVLGRSGESWVRKIEGKNDQPINTGAASKLLTDLTTLKVTRFVADMASDLKGFGLDTPTTTVTLSDYSTEGTPETKPGERPLAKLLLGKFEGDAGYAKLDDEPFIVAVSNTILENLWTDPIQWQPLTVLDLKQENLSSVEITRTGQAPITLGPDKEKTWKLLKGEGALSQAAAQSLINTLSTLRAVRWIGTTDAAKQGMEKPNLTIQYTLTDKKSAKLTIGSATPDEMWHATLEGFQGTFLISKPDFDALNAALIEAAKAAGTSATPTSPNQPAAPITVTTEPVGIPATVDPQNPAGSVTPETPKATEAPAGNAKPAPESAPKTQ